MKPLRLLRVGVITGATTTAALLVFSMVTRSATLSGGSIRMPHLPGFPWSGPARTPQTDELRARGLAFPVPAVAARPLHDTFDDPRAGGARTHHAIDILAPRQSAVVAVDDGRLERMDRGQAGGIAIYQRDPTGRFCYYYAHLDGYADELLAGQALRKGQVLGYVGTTGNAPASTPHLHFAIWGVTPLTRCTGTIAIDPYAVFGAS